MKRLFVAVAASVLLAAPAGALPPLQPHAAPIVLGEGGAPASVTARAEEALRAASARTGMFLYDPPGLPMTPIRACAGKADPRACLRPPLLDAPRGDPTVPVHIVILVRQARPGVVRMTCVGAGKAPADAARQSILVDLAEALSSDAAVNEKPLNDISRCVFDAMNEHLT